MDWLADVVLLLLFPAIDLVGFVVIIAVVILKESLKDRAHAPLELFVALHQDLVLLVESGIFSTKGIHFRLRRGFHGRELDLPRALVVGKSSGGGCCGITIDGCTGLRLDEGSDDLALGSDAGGQI